DERVDARLFEGKSRSDDLRRLEDRGDPHPARRAHGDQPSSRAALMQELRERRNEPRSGRRERVADRDAAALDVQLATVDRAERPIPSELLSAEFLRLPGLERRERLRGERLVNLVVVEVL